MTDDLPAADPTRTPALTACSLCCGETLGQDDPDAGGQRRRLEDLQARGLTRLTWVECLDECDRGDVVVARPRRRSAQHSPVWFARLAGDTATAELAMWLRAGGPGESPVPRPLSALVVRRGAGEADSSDRAGGTSGDDGSVEGGASGSTSATVRSGPHERLASTDEPGGRLRTPSGR